MEYYKDINPENQLRGKSNRADGKLFENMIEASCELYSSRGAAFILVSLNFEKFYKVPWDMWKTMKERFRHKYMAEEDLKKYRVRFVGGNILFL